jgi:predicted ATPase
MAPFVRRVRIRNYKSISRCDVALGSLTVLIGRNGAGKSNFLDALRFVMDGLQSSLDHAVKSRGGIDGVRRRSTGHPKNFAIELELTLGPGREGRYGFEIGAQQSFGFFVKREHLVVPHASFKVRDGQVEASGSTPMPPASPDRLYLVNAAGIPQFRESYDRFLRMGFYNLNPEIMKQPQKPDVSELLRRDGGNIASVIARLGATGGDSKARIQAYLRKIVPGIVDIDRVPLGPWETLEFRQEVQGAKHPWKFYAASMSDGTLRALGALVATTQLAGGDKPVTLVGLEEPETALHPAAAGALMDAIREAAAHTQVVVTSHSPDLLDQIEPDEVDQILAVQSSGGETEIGPIDEAGRTAVRGHLYQPGDLLRMDQLTPDPADLRRQKQMKLLDIEDGDGNEE